MGQCWGCKASGGAKGKGKGGGGGARASWMGGGNGSASGQEMMDMVMQMMGMAAPGGGKRQGGGGQEPPAKKRKITVTDSDLLWKNRLSMAHAKKHSPEPIPKGAFEYVTENDGDSWVSMLSCEKFDSNYPGTGSSKKEAEEDAAKSAFEGEFPEIWEKLSKKVREEGPQVLKQRPAQQQQFQAEEEGSVKMKKSLLREDLQWRTRLSTALGQHLGAVPGPDALTYTNEKLEGNTGFRSTLSSEHFEKEYSGGKCASKKLAEENVAKNAFQNEFGTLFAQLPIEIRQQKAGKVGANKAVQAAADTAKANHEIHPKGELTQALCLKLGRSMTKEDISYAFKEQGGMLVPTLTITCLDKKGAFEGEPIEAGSSKADKKTAEGAVATQAMVAYKKLFAGNAAKQEAKKVQVKEAWEIRRKEMQAKTSAEKEAKQAAKEAKVAA